MKTKFLLSIIVFITCNLHGLNATEPTWFQQMATINDTLFAFIQHMPNAYEEDTTFEKIIRYVPNARIIKHSNTYCYINAVKSNDGNSLFLYPWLSFMASDIYVYKSNQNNNKGTVLPSDMFSYCNDVITHDIGYKGAYKYLSTEEYEKIKANNIVKIGGSKAKKYCGADSFFIVDYPDAAILRNAYSHTIGIFLIKEGRVPVPLKLFLTDKGYKQRKEIIKEVCNSMSFANKEWTFGEDKVQPKYVIEEYNKDLPNIQRSPKSKANRCCEQ